MRVFRSSYTDKEGRNRATAMLYIEFRDHMGIRRRLAGFADRRATESLGRNVQKLVWCRAGGQPLDPVLTKWVEGLSPYLMRKLAEFGVLDAGKLAALRPLAEHLGGAKDAPGWRQHLAAKGNTAQHVETSCSRVLKVIDGCKFAFWSDVSASKVLAYLDGLRANKAAADVHPDGLRRHLQQLRRVRGRQRPDVEFFAHAPSLPGQGFSAPVRPRRKRAKPTTVLKVPGEIVSGSLGLTFRRFAIFWYSFVLLT